MSGRMVPLDLVVDLAAAVKAGELTIEQADAALEAWADERDMEGHPS